MRYAGAPALACLLACAACSPAPDNVRGAVALEACRLPGLDRPALCGSHEVWEDRELRAGRRIALAIGVIPARLKGGEPDPIVVLAGGPGQGAIALAKQVAPLFSRLNDSRDIVLVDQRGTGRSRPLACEAGGDRPELFDLLDDSRLEARLRQCLDSLDADPRHYATAPAVADLDEVLGALGYARVNLWGGSYGTRVALELMRRHPGRVRTATLDGVAPTDMKLPLSFAADAEAAFERLLADCEAEPACRGAYPELRRDASTLRESLARKPAAATLADPVSGAPRPVQVTQGVFLSGLFRPLYVPAYASLLPLAVTRAARGDFNPLLAPNLEFARGVAENLAIGMHLSVVCSEDVARIGPADLAAAARTFFGLALAENYLRACRLWPKARVPADAYEPVRAATPVLVLSGGLDPATPPRLGEAVVAHLPNARHAVAPNLAHGVSGRGCVTRLVEKFVRAADARPLDLGCLERIPRPLFMLPPGRPP